MKLGTKVVLLESHDRHKIGKRGTLKHMIGERITWVEWDDGTKSIEPIGAIAPIHALKMALKHGPRIGKRSGLIKRNENV